MRLLDRWVLAGLWIGCLVPAVMPAAEPGELTWPPKLPGGRTVVSDRGEAFLVAPPGLSADVKIAKTPPSVDFLYYPGQDYPGNPWSVWGDSVAVGGKYYSAIGDHIGPAGNAFVYEYDPATGKPPVKIAGAIGLRSATQETSDGYVYTVSTRCGGSRSRPRRSRRSARRRWAGPTTSRRWMSIPVVASFVTHPVLTVGHNLTARRSYSSTRSCGPER